MNKQEIKLYEEALEKAKKLALLVKNKDYNSGIELSDYWIYGAKSIIHELHKKVLRLKSLESRNFQSNSESAIDNCLDLINYATFLYIYLKMNKSGENDLK